VSKSVIPHLIYHSFFLTQQLQGNLNTTLARRTALLQGGEEVGDVVPGMPVQTSPEPLLVEEMSNETNAATEHEETIEDTHAKVVLSLLRRESAAVAHEVDKADSDATVNVKNEVVLLGGSDRFDGQSVVEQLSAGEVVLDELLDKLDAKIRVVP
jgi:hypothetical protein